MSRRQTVTVVLQFPNKQEVEVTLPEHSPVSDLFPLAEEYSEPPSRYDAKNCQLIWKGTLLGNNMYLDYYRLPPKAKIVIARRMTLSSSGRVGSANGGRTSSTSSRRREDGGDQYSDNNQYDRSSRGGTPSNVPSRNASSHRQTSANTSFEDRPARPAPSRGGSSRPSSPNNNWGGGGGPDRDGYSRSNDGYVNSSQQYQQQRQQRGGDDDGGRISSYSPAAEARPSALHSYRIRELEVQLSRANEQYHVAQDRIAELEASVQRLSNVAKRSLELQLQQQQVSSSYTSNANNPGPTVAALQNEYAQAMQGSVLRSPSAAAAQVGSPNSNASTIAPSAASRFQQQQPPQDGMHRQLEELRESYRRQGPTPPPPTTSQPL